MTDSIRSNHYVDIAAETTVSDDETTVTVRRITTPKGERLEIRSDDNAIRIDALGLESLAWQDRDVFEEFLDGDAGPIELAEGDDGGEVTCEFTLSNEYADVVVRTVRAIDGEYIVVEAPKKHFSIRAHAVELDALADQDTSVFSEFLTTPHGPDGHAH